MAEIAAHSSHIESVNPKKCDRCSNAATLIKAASSCSGTSRLKTPSEISNAPKDVKPQPIIPCKSSSLKADFDETVHERCINATVDSQRLQDNVMLPLVPVAQAPLGSSRDGVARRAAHHTVVHQTFCNTHDSTGPRILQESSLHWLVFKPRGWECSGLLLDRARDGGPSCLTERDTPLLEMESTETNKSRYPILLSERHNFGVVLHLERHWCGITLIAKSEESYHEFLELLEAGLIKCQLSCLVESSSRKKALHIEGRTRYGDSPLRIAILECIDFTGTKREAATHNESGRIRSNQESMTATCAITRVCVEIDFPPILMDEILKENGMRLVRNTDLVADQAHSDTTSICCCYGVSFVEPRPGSSLHLMPTLRKISVESKIPFVKASNNSTVPGLHTLNMQISDWASHFRERLKDRTFTKSYSSSLLYRLALCGALGCASSILWARLILPVSKMATGEFMCGIRKEAATSGCSHPAQILRQLLPCPSSESLDALRLCCDPLKCSIVWPSTNVFCGQEPVKVEYLFGDAEGAVWKQQLK